MLLKDESGCFGEVIRRLGRSLELLEQGQRLATHRLLDHRKLMQPGPAEDRLEPNTGGRNPTVPAGYLWTFAALRLSTGARAHYDRRRVAGDRHTAAQRHLFNRFLGCLYYCLQTSQTYAEDLAFPTAQRIAA